MLQGRSVLRSSPVGRFFYRRTIRLVLFGAFLLLSVFGLLSASKSSLVKPEVASPAEWLRPSRHPFDITTDTLTTLVPADKANANVCKLLLSAALLGYAPPILINWGKSFIDTSVNFNGSHIAKLTGVTKFLKGLPPSEHSGLVLIIDGHDSWFQLPREVLVSRYRDINRLLTAKEREALGVQAYDMEKLTQSILFSAEKTCGPNLDQQINEVGCYGQPFSPLPSHIYGQDTDILDAKTHLSVHFRPHWLNSGMFIGPVGDVLKMVERAVRKSSEIEHHGSDQYIFHEIYGEQEFQRQLFRLKYRTLLGILWDSLEHLFGYSKASITDPNTDRIPPKLHGGKKYQFGIGLDYGLQIVQSTVLSEFDGQWLKYNDKAELAKQQIAFGRSKPTATEIPADLIEAKTPYNMLLDPEMLTPLVDESNRIAAETRRLAQLTWEDVPLYTNLYTSSIPAIIHMNGYKKMREGLWDRMWYSQHARTLLRAYERSTKSRIGAYADTGEWLPYAEICAGTGDEVFRDGLGDWSA